MEEKKQIKRHLEEELKNIHFSTQSHVLKRINQRTWKVKLNQFWNKEISIPLLPVSSAFVLLLFGYGFFNIYELNQQPFEQKELVEIGGNTYWKNEVEGLLDNEDDN